MNKIIPILNDLPANLDFITRSESDEILEIRVKCQDDINLDKRKINELVNSLNLKDTLIISVLLDDLDPITFNSSNQEVKNFIDEIENEKSYFDEGEIELTIFISKNTTDSLIYIYDLLAFQNKLESYSPIEFFTVLNRAFNNSNSLDFYVPELEKTISSGTIRFLSEITERKEKEVERLDYFKKFNSITSSNLTEKNWLIPQDLFFADLKEPQGKISSLCTKYSLILSICYLFDITEIRKDTLYYKLNGYKTFTSEINFKCLLQTTTPGLYFKIYKWVYEGGSLIDKIGLARNIISLNIKNSSHLNLADSTFNSIQSSFKIYEKENIQQYLTIKSKISEQLLLFNERADRIVGDFAKGFKNNAIALLSFYVSAITLRVLTNGNFINVFTLDALIISFAFLLISLLYFLVSRWEIKKEQKRFEQQYCNLKQRYLDVLNEQDINRILNNNKGFQDNVEYMSEKKKRYSQIWIFTLAILLLSSFLLHIIYDTHNIQETELYKMIQNIFNEG